MFFHHKTIHKYTAALLSTFNGIETQYAMSDGTIKAFPVPIKFSSREKATILSEYETSQILEGNTNILPRMSLTFESMNRASERMTNKFIKSGVAIGDEMKFQYNAIPYDFMFNIVLQARGMGEATMIAEQIAAYFNPTYPLRIYESPTQKEPTTCHLVLESIQMESEEYEDISTNVVTVLFGLLLKGNIYPPIKDSGILKTVSINTGLDWGSNVVEASTTTWGIGGDGLKDFSILETKVHTDAFDNLFPTIESISHIGDLTAGAGLTVEMSVDISGVEFDPLRMSVLWYVKSGQNTIELIPGEPFKALLHKDYPETTIVGVKIVGTCGTFTSEFTRELQIS